MHFYIKKKEYLYSPITVIAAWLTGIMLTQPLTNTFVHDDWVYAMIVKNLIETGTFTLPKFCGATAIAQVYWGRLFCIGGFSEISLKISTMVLSLMSIIFMFQIVKLLTNSNEKSFWVTCVIALNPLFMYLSASFMSDIPCLAFSLGAIFFYLLIIHKKSLLLFIPATIFSIIAILTRQTTIVIPIAFVFLYIKDMERKFILISLLGTMISIASYIIFTRTISSHQGEMSSYYGNSKMILSNISFSLDMVYSRIVRLGQVLFYCGIFALPLVLFLFRRTINIESKAYLIGFIISISVVSAWNFVPMENNYNDFYLGPLTLKDIFSVKREYDIKLPPLVWSFIKTTCLYIVLMLSYIIFTGLKYCKDKLQRKSIHSLLIFCLIYVLIHLFAINYYERYFLLIYFVAVAVAMMFVNINKRTRIMAGTLLFVLYVLSIIMVHDYFSWNRARFRAANQLLKQGVKPSEMDAGYEFTGWYNYDDTMNNYVGKSFWWVKDDNYIIAFNKLAGTNVIGKESYSRWIDKSWQYIYVLKKKNVDSCTKNLAFTYNPNKQYHSNKNNLPGDCIFLLDDSIPTIHLANNAQKRIYTWDSSRLYGFNSMVLNCQQGDYICFSGIITIKKPIVELFMSMEGPDNWVKIAPTMYHIKDNTYRIQFDQYSSNSYPTNLKFFMWNPGGNNFTIDSLSMYLFRNAEIQ